MTVLLVLAGFILAQDKDVEKICAEFDRAWANAKPTDQSRAVDLLRQKTDPDILKRLVNVLNNYKADEGARQQSVRIIASNYAGDADAVKAVCRFIEKIDKKNNKKDSVVELSISMLGQMDRKLTREHVGAIDDLIEEECGKQFETSFGLAAVQVAQIIRSKTTIPKLIKLFKKLQSNMRSYFQANRDKDCDGG